MAARWFPSELLLLLSLAAGAAPKSTFLHMAPAPRRQSDQTLHGCLYTRSVLHLQLPVFKHPSRLQLHSRHWKASTALHTTLLFSDIDSHAACNRVSKSGLQADMFCRSGLQQLLR
jgi:hypothetical protein